MPYQPVLCGLWQYQPAAFSEDSQTMYVLQGFVEIGQDAAAVVDTGTPGVVGVFTDSIQTCMIAAVECDKGFVVIHDSAQLQLPGIAALITTMGRCKKLSVVVPAGSQDQHSERITRLKRITGVAAKNFTKLTVPSFGYAVSYTTDGGMEVHAHGATAASLPLPEKGIRTSIAEINNFFIKSNSQSLAVDVQFSDGRYNAVKPIQKTVEQLMKVLSEQPKYFFNNAALLYAANDLGLLVLPSDLVRFVEDNALQPYRTSVVPAHDQQRQAMLFNKFVSSRSV
ncbi:hypothetical protein OE494_29410 [Pseudomonas aeruginosa]|uniref:hypothetical protein n=2 Tax=Pseudomonas aeruginosa TaxID=287 RepID=UPI0021D91B62|nr:hypothetical protein [Pseudomonas aeruginosa]EIY2823594.1 hypothetical protein [Pseudomonas aeruginosa]EJS3802557.1 hypothetical protein [Pseudomonas aeruginosa]EJS3851958.1 hypothetical protein [Pseudomonas aeruginosa]EKE3927987.1 hypothetical protein [Pseudomonas aeruginosa]